MILTWSFDRWRKGGTEQVNYPKSLREESISDKLLQVNLISCNTCEGISCAPEEKRNELVFNLCAWHLIFKNEGVSIMTNKMEITPCASLPWRVRHTDMLQTLISWLRQLHSFT